MEGWVHNLKGLMQNETMVPKAGKSAIKCTKIQSFYLSSPSLFELVTIFNLLFNVILSKIIIIFSCLYEFTLCFYIVQCQFQIQFKSI